MNCSLCRRFTLLIATFGLLVLCAFPALADSVITLNSNLQLQEIQGFGASDAWYAPVIHGYPPAMQKQILDDFFSTTTGAGLSMLRHRIPPSIEPAPNQWDWTTDNDAIWLTNQAIQRGVGIVWSTPWTPPAWMKSNNDVNNGGYLLPSHYQDYANYLATYIQHYQTWFKVRIAAVSLQNEPDITASYESCNWTGQEFHDFLAGFLIPTFKKDGITAKVIMPEQSGWFDNLAGPTLADPTTANFIYGVATHDYWGTITPFADAEAAGKRVWETEVSNLGTNDPSINDALYWAQALHTSLVVGHANAWHYWWLFTSDSTGQSLITGDGFSTFTVNKRLWTIGNFSRFVRPGFRMVGLSSNNPESGVYTSAFLRQDSGQLVIVAINSNNNTTNLGVNLPAYLVSSLTPYRTSATEDLATLLSFPVSGNSFSYALAPQSVTTFVGQGAIDNPQAPVRIDAGGTGAGSFSTDFDYTAGNSFGVSAPIDTSGVTSPAPQEVYQTQRWGQFQYIVPGLTPYGKYTVRLHFAETYWTGPGQRLFNVTINGQPELANFDVFQAAGGMDKAVVKQFTTRATQDGKVVVQFTNGLADNAMVSGIEVQ
jgi:glucuronoarabinoxylan endo-1,4-beta-xylanase